MILRRTGDTLEKSNKANLVMNIVIIILVLIILCNLLTFRVQLNARLNSTGEIESIQYIEDHLTYGGILRGLNTSLNGGYVFDGRAAYTQRWALSEYAGERVLEEVYRRVGDTGEADAAHARAEKWSAGIGPLADEQAAFDAELAAGVWP